MDGDALAAEAQISAANRRVIEMRAEAAMLVEAVEDRAASVRSIQISPRSLMFTNVLLVSSCQPWLTEAMHNRRAWARVL